MTHRQTELRDTQWGVAAPVTAERLIELARERLPRNAAWKVIQGNKLAALLVGDGEPDDSIARDLARAHGRAFLLDFHDEAASTDEIVQSGREKRLRDHPAAFLSKHNIVAPGYEPRSSPVRSVLIVEHVLPDDVRRAFSRDDYQFVSHPRGTLVRGNPARSASTYATRLKAPVYSLLHNTETGDFQCFIKQPTKRQQCFDMGEFANRDRFEMIDSVMGASTPVEICKALEIDPVLLGLTPETVG